MSRKNLGLLAIMALLAAMVAFWAWQMRYAVSASQNQAQFIEVAAAHAQATKGELVLVDIRRPSEWRASGVPASAHAITMHQDASVFVDKLLAATGGRRDRPLAVICATGGRTTWLQSRLQAAGFTQLRNATEGMFGSQHGPGWLKKGLPVRQWSQAAPSPAASTK